MGEALLQVSALHAGYGRAEVLTGLDLRLERGNVVTVIGPDGAGKSTTLNALMAVLPSRGQVVFDGIDLADVDLEERVMLGMALVPEARAVRHYAGRGQPHTWRLSLDEASQAQLARGTRSGIRALSAAEGAAQSAGPARCRAVGGRCWPSAGR